MNPKHWVKSPLMRMALVCSFAVLSSYAEAMAEINLARFDSSKLRKENVSDNLSEGEFRALGFTKEGWLLVLSRMGRVETNSGCYVELRVLNLVDDSQVDAVSSEECEMPKNEKHAFIQRWNPRLNSSASLEKFPLHAKGDELTASIRIRKESEGQFSEEYGDVWLTSRRQGEKRIGTIADSRALPNAAQIVGFLRTTTKNRIAVVVGFPSRSMGETKLDQIAYQVMGAHLAVGFSSPHNKSLKPTNPATGGR